MLTVRHRFALETAQELAADVPAAVTTFCDFIDQASIRAAAHTGFPSRLAEKDIAASSEASGAELVPAVFD